MTSYDRAAQAAYMRQYRIDKPWKARTLANGWWFRNGKWQKSVGGVVNNCAEEPRYIAVRPFVAGTDDSFSHLLRSGTSK